MVFDWKKYSLMYWEAYELAKLKTVKIQDTPELKVYLNKISQYIDSCGFRLPFMQNPHRLKEESINSSHTKGLLA